MNLLYFIPQLKRRILISYLKKKIYDKCHVSFGKNVDFNVQTIKISGNQNYIEIDNDVMLENCSFMIQGNNNKIIIGANCKFINTSFWIEGNNNNIQIGEFTNITGKTQLAACEGCSIIIGDNCLFSHDIYIRTTDSHKIYHKGKRINNPESINIGDHVWIGMQVLILKGSKIENNCVLGARTIITKNTPAQEYTLFGGQPAVILKEDIKWEI